MHPIAPIPSSALTSSLLRKFDPTSRSDSTFDKSVPYVPTKYGSYDVNENYKYFFKDGSLIVCRHLGMMWLIDQLLNGKVDYDLYRGGNIPKNIRQDVEKIFKLILMEAEIALIDNDVIGQHFGDIFLHMEATGKSETGGFLLSVTHAMSLVFTIGNDKKGVKKYVIVFYEPNATGTHVRIAHKEFLNLSKLGSLSTKNLLGEYRDDFYFRDSNTSLLAIFDKEQLKNIVDKIDRGIPMQSHQIASKSATVDFTIDTINSAHVFHLLIQGCDKTLEDLVPMFEHIKKSDPHKLARLVSAEVNCQYFGLYFAMVAGQDRVVTAYLKLFKLVPEKLRVGLLERATEQAIRSTLNDGYGDVIRAFRGFFLLVPSKMRASFLVKVTNDGMAMALRKGHVDAIGAFKELLELVPPTERGAVLAKVTVNGIVLALEGGQAEAIKAFKDLFELTLPKERTVILAKATANGIAFALHKGQADAIKAFKELFKLIPPEERTKLLTKATANGIALALKKGHVDAIKAFKELFELIPQTERADLLMSASEIGIAHALQQGQADAISAFRELVELITKEKQAALLDKVTDIGIAVALRNAHFGALKEYIKLVECIPIGQRLIFCVSVDTRKRQLLFAEFKSAKPENQKAFLNILLQLSFSGIPEVFREYMNLVNSIVLPGERQSLKGAKDQRSQLLLSDNQDDAELMLSAFRFAPRSEKTVFLEMLEEYGLTEEFTQSEPESSDQGEIE